MNSFPSSHANVYNVLTRKIHSIYNVIKAVTCNQRAGRRRTTSASARWMGLV